MLFHIITNNFKNVRHQRKSRMNKSSVLVVKDKHPIALQGNKNCSSHQSSKLCYPCIGNL